ncbi:MAG: hypothetical protein JJLCMIEE_00622 [Acidimicrobiales bacterium]|nr:MAG: ComEC/Rec2 family competence protein [Actinomycetota bacterium]MBV6507573.1 hypothetical protein [Acidimicrobiales bacterium]RIK07510.1 MAG: hypothetical protein DCC48_03135 [Acidobacteriota bacterium]
MSDRQAVVAAVAAVLGAWITAPVPLVPAVAAVVATYLWRKPLLLAFALLLMSSSLSVLAWEGTSGGVQGPVSGSATLTGDPETRGEAVITEIRLDGRRYEAVAFGPAGGVLRGMLAGEVVEIEGSAGPLRPEQTWLVTRHVVGEIEVTQARSAGAGGLAERLANRLRRLLVSGAESLDPDTQSLFTGLVVGDDRFQSAATAASFRAAGLTHLLAVSGQNVAFVLAVTRPLLLRLPLRARWATALAVLAFFALITRFEPSVLRATVMAGLATTASLLGRPASSVRLLALAVVIVVLVDPFLVHSLGFRLSVGASAGIVLLSRRLAERLPGPGFLKDPLSVTLAAQVGVAPFMIPAFGSIPLASLPANLLAGPAAGAMMAWGLTGGLLAGLAGAPAAALLHLPTRVLTWWIDSVASWSGALPLGVLDAGHLVVVAAAALLLVVGARDGVRGRRFINATGAVIAVSVLVSPVVSEAIGGHVERSPAPGVVVYRVEDVVVVTVDPVVTSAAEAVSALVASRSRRIDMLVVTKPEGRSGELVHQLREAMEVGVVLVPQGSLVRGAVVPAVGCARVGGTVVAIDAVEPDLQVSAGPASEERCGG